jgi:hypothetical protein
MLTATLAAICLLSGSAHAADITVSPTGGDVLHKARDAAKAGDRIVLRGGRYELSAPLVEWKEVSASYETHHPQYHYQRAGRVVGFGLNGKCEPVSSRIIADRTRSICPVHGRKQA